MTDRVALAARLRAAGCVFAEDEADLLLAEAAAGADLERLVTRRIAGEPLEHVVGWAAFCGLRIAVAPGVFVPRHRSELLAHTAIDLARSVTTPTVVELCCGAGAIGAALLEAGIDGLELRAADIDPVALACARENLESRGGRVHLGDLFAALPPPLRGRIDVLVANAPYVPTDEVALMPADARDHEPLVALDGGADGLGVLRRILDGAADWLAPGGAVVCETSRAQSSVLCDHARAAGLACRVLHDDELEATAVVATLD